MNKISRKKIRRVRDLMLLTAALFVVAVAALFLGAPWPLAAAGAAALVTGVQTYKTYRCPHCGKGLPYISPGDENAGDCPYCGETIEFDSKLFAPEA